MIHREWEQLKSRLYVPAFLGQLQLPQTRRRPRRCRSWRGRSRLGGWFPCPECCGEESSSSSFSLSSRSSESCSASSLTSPSSISTQSALDCPFCTGDYTPNEFSVVFDNIAENGCGDCAALNNTPIILDLYTVTIECGWRNFDDDVCEWTAVYLWVRVGGDLDVRVITDSLPQAMDFGKNFGGNFNCSSLNNEDIPLVSSSGDWSCDGSAATCAVTAL